MRSVEDFMCSSPAPGLMTLSIFQPAVHLGTAVSDKEFHHFSCRYSVTDSEGIREFFQRYLRDNPPFRRDIVSIT
jgi:hypothetical protein